MNLKRATICIILLALAGTSRAEQAAGGPGSKAGIQPFFKAYCIRCHGPEKSKGKMVVDALDADFSTGKELQQWERVLNQLKHGEMPPEDETQPDVADRKAVVAWIENGLRDFVSKSSQAASVPTARRLTNFEYQNTMRDLLGFELKLIPNLPEDPVKPYKFNNTAELMLIGPEQMDRYKENARRAMASAIVEPGTPKIHKSQVSWLPRDASTGLGSDEIGIDGNRRNTAASGMGLKSWPTTGEFRIRIKAAAILPPGIPEMPLRVVMGYSLNENLSTLQIESVGTLRLRNNADNLKMFELRGRIENFPVQVTTSKTKGELAGKAMHLSLQNNYDNGRLNDRLDPLAMPRAIVESMEFEAPLVDVWPPEHHTRILFDSPLRKSDEAAYVKEVLKRFMSRAYRRPVSADELERFEKIYKLYAQEFKTFEEAIRETLAMVLISPQFLYHSVTADGATRQYELASTLSYFLWGSMPDEVLMNLAAEGKLDDPTVIETQARRLLADPRSHGFVENFSSQWLGLAKVKSVKINATLFPRFLYLVNAGERTGTEVPNRPTIRDHMFDESVAFVGELIRRNASALNIVDSDFACLNEPLAVHYGVEGVYGDELRPVALKPEQNLGGALTHGSVLIGNSNGSAPHPIYRAVWLREAILGDEVKPPPADVPALSDTAGEAAEKAATIKDLLKLHRKKESCNDCHARLDPWGIPFEHYNATGRFQPMIPAEKVRVRGFNEQVDKNMAGYAAYLKSINTVKLQADARVPNGPQIDGMKELKAYLLKERKDTVAENVLRRLLTYAIGRELTYRDRFEVDRLLEQSKANDYKLQDMIIAICQSPAFRGVQLKVKGN